MEAIGQLAGGIAHDFNNLLTAIGGYCGFALNRVNGGDEELRRDLEEVQNSARRAGSLTQQLLAFSRRQVLQPEVIDLNAVVAETGNLLRRLIGEHIEVDTTLEPELGSVKADRGQIGQVLVNLALNARDAMPEGGVVSIDTANMTVGGAQAAEQFDHEGGDYVVLSVKDVGSGMDADVRERAFEPFFTTKGLGQGTGLGLSTVYGIVKQSGGHISLDSEPGRGTVVRVYLPRSDEPRRLERAADASPAPPGAETILLVEDEPVVRALVREMLEQHGYDVIEAKDPHDALRLSQEGTAFDLLFTDVVMPKLSGRDLAERIRLHRPGVKVLYMSGYTDLEIGSSIARAGTGFLQKPFTAPEVLRKVREVLDAPVSDLAVAI
jgi:CheY-like chemotaxis protein